MQHHINTLVRQFFQKQNLQQVTVRELQQFTEDYPFAAAGQFLYAQKLKESGQNGYKEQAEKTTLYFHNPIWSNWLMQDHKEHADKGPVAFQPAKEPVPVLVFEREYGTETASPAEPYTEDTDFTPPPPVQEETEKPVETTEQDETATTLEDKVADNETVTGEKDAPATPENIPAEIAIPHTNEQDDNYGMDDLNSELPEAKETAGVQAQQETPPSEPVQETTNEKNEQEKKVEPVTAVENTTAGEEDDIPFDSYHTIDYFASQGIKLKPEDLPKDRLGQQLKSFTDWLRSMKKIAPANDTDALDEITSQAIQQIAEHSVAGKEIITEAMAEVWAKQGHREKAVAIYEKLSLLNPAKTTYFAARIEQLKAV